MKNDISIKPAASLQQQYIIGLVLLLLSLFPARGTCAYSMDECLLNALKYADDSVTVGELREQCKEETETRTISKGSSAAEGTAFSNANKADEATGTAQANGPEEIVLKTSLAKKPAFFPHRTHQGRYTCATCHHGQDASGNLTKYTEEMTISKCTACHNPTMANEELNGFQDIGHKLCRECHRKHQDVTSARCSTCHQKNL